MSTKREFIVVTSKETVFMVSRYVLLLTYSVLYGAGVTYVQADGSYIIATRSMNNDINTKLKSSKSNGYVKSLVCMYVCMYAFVVVLFFLLFVRVIVSRSV